MAKRKRQKKTGNASPPERPKYRLRVSWKRVETSPWFRPALALAGLFMGLLFFDSNLSLSGDNAQFIDLGRALASGQGFSETLGDNPTPHTKYPFGFPVMLAVVETLFPYNITALKGLIVLLYAFSIPLTYTLIRRYAPPRRNAPPALALSVTLLCLVSPPMLDFSHQVMSEIPFLTVSLIALLLLERAGSVRKKGALIWAILAAMAAYYIRTAGVVLVGTGIVYFALHRRYAQAATLAVGSALLALPWSFRNAALGGTDYLNQLLSINPYRPQEGLLTLPTFVERIVANLGKYGLQEIPRVFLPSLVATPSWILGIGVGALLIHALVTGLRRKELPAVYLTCYLGLHLCWPQVWSDIRFLLPAIPLLFYAVLSSAAHLIARLHLQMPALSPKLVLALLFLLPLGSNIQAAHLLSERIGNYPANWKNYFEAAAWIQKNTDPQTRVACRKPFLMYVISNRKSGGYTWEPPEGLIEDLEKNRIDIVVVDQLGFASTPHYLVPAVNAFKERFQLLHRIPNPDTYILKFLPNK